MRREHPIRKRRMRWSAGPAPGAFYHTVISSSLLCRVKDYYKSSNKDLRFLRAFFFRAWTALRYTPSSSAYCRSVFSSKNSAWSRDKLTEPCRIRAWIFLYTAEIRGKAPDTDPRPNYCPESLPLKEAACTSTFPAQWCHRWRLVFSFESSG